MPAATFDPSQPFVEEAPQFDASQPFVEEQPKFDASQPFQVEGQEPRSPIVQATPYEPPAPPRDISGPLPPGVGYRAPDANDGIMAIPDVIGGVARGLVEDAGVLASRFKRPEGQPTTLLPSVSGVQTALARNAPFADTASGNLKASLLNQPHPIDAQINEAAKESIPAATLAHISQGIASTAPMAAIGALPAAAQKAALLGFTAKMISDAPHVATELGAELGKPKEQQDPDKIANLVSEAIQITGFSALGGAHLGKAGIDYVRNAADANIPSGVGFKPEFPDQGKQPILSTNPNVSPSAQSLSREQMAQDLRDLADKWGGVVKEEKAPQAANSQGNQAESLIKGVQPAREAIQPQPAPSVNPPEQAPPAPTETPKQPTGTREDRMMEQLQQLPEEKWGETPAQRDEPLAAFRNELSQLQPDIGLESITMSLREMVEKAARDPDMKPVALQAFQELKAKADQLGLPIDKVKQQLSREFQAKYGADAPEMAKYYFGEQNEVPKTSQQQRLTTGQNAVTTEAAPQISASVESPVYSSQLASNLSHHKGPFYTVSVDKIGRRQPPKKAKDIAAVESDKKTAAALGRTEFYAYVGEPSENVVGHYEKLAHPSPPGGGLSTKTPAEVAKSNAVKDNPQVAEFKRQMAERAKNPTADDLAVRSANQFPAKPSEPGTTSGAKPNSPLLGEQKPPVSPVKPWESEPWFSAKERTPEIDKIAQAQFRRANQRLDYAQNEQRKTKFPSSGISDAMRKEWDAHQRVIDTERARLEAIKQYAKLPKPSTDLPERSMGAMRAGELEAPAYDPASQLRSQLETLRESDPKTRITLAERIGDKLAAGKSLLERAKMRAIAVKESIKQGMAAPVITELRKAIGGFDWEVQRSSAVSRELAKAIEITHPDRTRRDAIAVYVDSGMDVNRIREAMAQLPDKVSPKIRRAFQSALNLTEKEKASAEMVRDYFGKRMDDAKQAGVLETFLEDYYTHIWKDPKRAPKALIGAMNSGRVVEYWENSRQRKLESFIDGIKLGYEPVLDPSLVLPRYNFNLDRAIASRAFIKNLSKLTEADGRPTVAPTGIATKIEGDKGTEATLVKPKVKAQVLGDYKLVDNPSLRKWKWVENDSEGKPILVQGDLAVHPNALERVRNMMDKNRLTPTWVVRNAIRAGAEIKGAKLGILSPFHQIHVGSHGLWHLVNPFNAAKIDWTSSKTKFAVESGLKLSADYHDKIAFSEGLGPGLLAQKLVPYARAYSEYLFEGYIPRLKLKTFQAVYERDSKRYAGKLSPDQIAARSADAVNNAYGELNRLWLGKDGRDPRFQRAMQVTLLAPDFLEARARFIGKAMTPAGKEERMALIVMGTTLYVTARVLNQLIDGDPHMEPEMMFSVRHDDKNYSVRSVIGDTQHLLTDWRSFAAHRINPLTTRTIVEGISGRELNSGLKRDTLGQLKDLMRQIVPAQADTMLPGDREWWEGTVQSLGVTSRHQPTSAEIAKRKAREEKEKTNPSKYEFIYRGNK